MTMRNRRALLWLLGTSAVAASPAFSACSTAEKPKPPPLVLQDDDAAKPSTPPTTPTEPPPPPPPPDAGPPKGTIYAHTGRTLFLFEPYGKTLTRIGDFSCLNPSDRLSEVGDIAVNRDGEVYGTTLNGRFLRIDPASATCTEIAQVPNTPGYPNSLSFVPRGTLDPANDALVGYNEEDYVRIDVATGNITKIGTLNPPDASTRYRSSGDVVSIGQERTYLTAHTLGPDGGDLDAGDVLVQVDPKTGRRLRIAGNTGRKNLYGMGYWGGKAYGFNAAGEILSIDPQSATTTPLPIPRPDASATQGVWYGAGSTTVAPSQ